MPRDDELKCPGGLDRRTMIEKPNPLHHVPSIRLATSVNNVLPTNNAVCV